MDAHERGQRFNPPDPQRLGVAGAGAMGSGIALVALLAGFHVALYDLNPAILERAAQYIEAQLQKRKRLLDLEYLTTTSRLEDFAGCSLVIEAVPEDLTIKQDLFTRLSVICPPPAVLATNTSTLPVTAIAAAADDPTRVGGMHFFNPAAVMPLVEVIRGAQTSPETADFLVSIARQMGKQPVLAKDTPGFIVNRIARPFYGEALRIVAEGAAAYDVVDTLVRSAGFKMGPFQLMDLIGIDINFAATLSVFEQTFYEPRYRPSHIQAQMVAQKALGRKTGRGFYRYDQQGNPLTPRGTAQHDQPCLGEGRKIAVSPGTFAPGLAGLLSNCGWEVTGLGGPLQDAAAVVVAAGRREAAEQIIRGLSPALPPGIPLIIQCADLAPSEAAAWAGHPERLVGFDGLFLTGGGPVTLALLPGASLTTADAAAGIFRSTGMQPVLISESPALVLPRIVCALVNEAAFALGEGVAEAETIDTAMKLGTNYPRGPLEWGRAIGFARVAAVLDHLREEYGEERYRLAPLLRRWARADGA